MSARDFRSTGQIRGAKDGIGHRIKEWMIWAEKRSSAAPNLSRKYTPAEVSRHNTKNDLWIIVDNVIYDVTLFSMYHPGGKEILHKWGGKDCTEEYQRLHGWVDHRTILQGYIIGTVSGGRTTPTRAGITTTPNKPLPSSNSSSNTNKEVASIFDAAQKIGLFRGVTSTQKDLMIRVASNGDKATGRVSPNARSGISSEDEVLLASLFDELDAQKTGYVLRSQVEQLINALNEGEAMDATTLQRLQSMRSELINRRQFVLLFL